MTDASDTSDPIGRVTVTDGHGTIVATLLGVNRWQVTIDGRECPEWAESLARQYEGWPNGPEDGFYGQLILRDLAQESGGQPEMIAPLPPSSSEAIY